MLSYDWIKTLTLMNDNHGDNDDDDRMIQSKGSIRNSRISNFLWIFRLTEMLNIPDMEIFNLILTGIVSPRKI